MARASRIRLILGALVCIGVTALSGCDDAKEAWAKILRKCMSSDVMGRTLYFGPSNLVGPGAIWRPDRKGYYLRWVLEDAGVKPPDSLIKAGEWSQCEGEYSSNLEVKPSVVLETKVQPISGELAADLNKATSIRAKVGKWRSETVQEGPWLKWLNSLPADNGYKADAKNKDFRICLRAYRINDFSAELKFSAKDAVTLKAKYSDQSQKLGDVGASVDLKWTSDTTLKVSSAGDFYVAGELGRIDIISGGMLGITKTVTTFDTVKQDRPVFSERRQH